MAGEWTEDPQGAWQYARDSEYAAPGDLVAFHPDDPVEMPVAGADPALAADVPAELVACPTCGTGVHPDRIR